MFADAILDPLFTECVMCEGSVATGLQVKQAGMAPATLGMGSHQTELIRRGSKKRKIKSLRNIDQKNGPFRGRAWGINEGFLREVTFKPTSEEGVKINLNVSIIPMWMLYITGH